jgi:hypothetical protein
MAARLSDEQRAHRAVANGRYNARNLASGRFDAFAKDVERLRLAVAHYYMGGYITDDTAAVRAQLRKVKARLKAFEEAVQRTKEFER